MTYRILIGMSDPELLAGARAMVSEDPELSIVDPVASAGELMAALSASDVDAVLVHEGLGPLPVLDLARDLGIRFPHIGVVLVVRERTPEMLRAALQAGVRDVLELPLSFEELQGGLKSASGWSRTLRQRMQTEIEEEPVGLGGRIMVVAGAKGGVGTTTLAAQLALEGASATKNRPVCLVDLDLQNGDVGVLLDVVHRRSIIDLLEVADDISARHLDEILYRHPSGLRVLLAPPEGELAEDVTGVVARAVLGAIKFRHEIVVVDVGCGVSEATAAAVEMADEVVVVVTPDVPAMRAANRLISMWERLQIRKDGMRCVVNRVSKDREVQPELVRKVVEAPIMASTIPASFRALEPALNTGTPARLQDGLFKRAIAGLARELEVVT